MKKLAHIFIIVLLVLVAFVFSSCGMSKAKKAEKKLIEAERFISAESKSNETALLIKEDKAYSLYALNSDTKTMETYEGTWSYVMTYKFRYKSPISSLGLIYTWETVTWNIFKLDDYFDRGKQGYFIHKDLDLGLIYCTDEDMTESHFEQYKDENGYIPLRGQSMSVDSKYKDSLEKEE